jgi:hypothetical protein
MDIICRYFPITRALFGWVILDIGGGLLQNPCDVWIAELDELDERESIWRQVEWAPQFRRVNTSDSLCSLAYKLDVEKDWLI